MDSPPRIDEWMPLATQQLRLRHLNRIIGLNILCQDGCKLYFTLHRNLDSPPFYKSSYIQSNSEAILWDNISCPELMKSNLRALCVRVWEHSANELKEQNRHLFTWRVWFSGLVLTSSKHQFSSNTLIFQLNKKYFSSSEKFSLDHHHPNNLKINNTDLIDLSNGKNFDDITETRYSTAQRWLNNNFKEQFLKDDIDVMAFSDDDSFGDVKKTHYITALRLRSSTRQSYTLDKLLRIQKIQRSCKRINQDILEISQQIINLNVKPKNSLSKRRTLDYLLSDIDETNPQAIVESKQLKKQIELLRFKCNLLEKEREQSILKTEEMINRLQTENELTKDRYVVFQKKKFRLSEEKSEICEGIKVILNGVKTKKELQHMINKRLSLLCRELKHIYPIKKNALGCFTVSNIPFPEKDYFSSNPLQTDQIKLMTPVALSVTLGFVAHLVQITAIILDKPLRYPLQDKSYTPSKQILYGIYLLNQNIAQLNYDVFRVGLDPRATIENFLKLFCSIIKKGEEKEEEEEVDGEINILDGLDRIGDFQKPRSSIDPKNMQVDRISMRKSVATEDKRYHSENNLKTLAEHCLKHSYSQERLDKN